MSRQLKTYNTFSCPTASSGTPICVALIALRVAICPAETSVSRLMLFRSGGRDFTSTPQNLPTVSLARKSMRGCPPYIALSTGLKE